MIDMVIKCIQSTGGQPLHLKSATD